jgi:hypothetical protein
MVETQKTDTGFIIKYDKPINEMLNVNNNNSYISILSPEKEANLKQNAALNEININLKNVYERLIKADNNILNIPPTAQLQKFELTKLNRSLRIKQLFNSIPLPEHITKNFDIYKGGKGMASRAFFTLEESGTIKLTEKQIMKKFNITKCEK